MMTASKRILAAMSAIGVAATLASCQLPGGSSGEKGGVDLDLGISAEVGAAWRWQQWQPWRGH